MHTLQAQGEFSEAKFQCSAMLNALIIAKPFGQFQKFDFITEFNGILKRVQVKSIAHKKVERGIRKNKYGCHVAYNKAWNKKEKYTKKDVDVVACYILPLDLWYLIPIEDIDGFQVTLSPEIKNTKNKYEKFR